MNKMYRVIWNSALRCFVVASELATGKTKSATACAIPALLVVTFTSSAAGQLVVDGTQATYDNYRIATGTAGQPGILVTNGGELAYSNNTVTTTGVGAHGAIVQNGSTLNLINASLSTFSANAYGLMLTDGSKATMQGGRIWNMSAGSSGIYATGNSQFSGSNINVETTSVGVYANGAMMDFNTLGVNTSAVSGYGVYALGADSQVSMTDATIATTGSSAIGLYANNGGTISGNNVNITTTGQNARGVYSIQSGSNVTLDGGSITTSAGGGQGVYAGYNASADISNMTITTTATGQPDMGGAAALYVETGGHIKADNVTLSSAQNAVWMRAGTLDANNVKISQSSSGRGPAIWGFSGSMLNLTNSDITLAAVGTQGIYTDAGTANLDNVKIHGEAGGTALTVRYDGQLNAKNLDIAINNADGNYASGLYLTRGSGKTQATVEDSRIVVNGSNATAVISALSGQNAAVKNTLIASDNIAVKVNNGAGLSMTAVGSTLIAPTLLSAGDVNTTGAKTGNVYLDASDASSLSGDVVLNRDFVTDSRLSLDTNSVWQGTSTGLNTLNLSNNSQWNMTGDSDVGNLNLADSTINFAHDTDSFKTLTVDGDFTSNNGTLVMNSVLANDGSAHDALQVLGNTSGDTNVVINKAGGTGEQTIQGIEVISVAGESAGDFRQQGRIVSGAYDYHLTRGTDAGQKNWYLISDVSPVDVVDPTQPAKPVVMITRPEAGSYLANMAAAQNMFNLRLHDRGGETQYVDAITGEQKTTSLWMRNVGGHNTSTDSSGQLKTQTNRYVLQIGGDLGKWSFNGDDSLHIGTMAGYGNAQSNTDSKVTGHRSQGEVSGYSLSMYGTWYQNAATQTGAYVDSWAQYNWFNNSVKGDDLPQESYKSKGISASVEGGYKWKVGEDSAKNSYFIEPNAQFVWSNIQANDLTEDNGTQVSSQGNGNVQSRVGVRASMKTHGEKQQPSFQPYIEANWINNTQNAGATLNDVNIDQRGSKNIAEVRAGVDGQLTQRVNLWGNVGQQMGSESYRDTSAMLGVKVSF